MKVTLKTILAVLIIVFAANYITGCNSAEQTTAKIAYSQGDWAKAEQEFLKETQQNPTNEEAWFYLTMSRIRLNKIPEAQQSLNEYRKIGKNTFNSELIEAWGSIFDLGYKAVEEASKYKNDTARVMPLYTQALNYFSIAKMLEPDSTIAQENINAVNNKINALVLKPILDKGIELEKAGDYAGAIEQYKLGLPKVQKGTANYEVVIYDLGVAYLKWGEKIRDSLAAANSEETTFKTQYQLALPYLEDLAKSTDIANKKQAYELLVPVYGNLGMIDKAKEAAVIRDQLNSEKK